MLKESFWPSWHPGDRMVLTSKANLTSKLALFSGVCLHFQRVFCQSQVTTGNVYICYKAVPIIIHESVGAFTHWKLPCGATGGWDTLCRAGWKPLLFCRGFLCFDFVQWEENRCFRISSGKYQSPCIVSISSLFDGLIWVFSMVKSTVLKLRGKKKPFYLNQKTPMWNLSYAINLLMGE